MVRKQKPILDAIEFGKRMAKVRDEVLNMSQTEFANEIGATQMMISRLETGSGGNIKIIYSLVSYLHEKGFRGETLFLPDFKISYLKDTVDEIPIQSQCYHKLKMYRDELEERTKEEVEELTNIMYLISQQP